MHLKFKKFIKTIILLSAILSGNIIAQDLPNVIPPSPEAANFMRYGEIPVDISTGVPEIKIPLYTLTIGKLSLPLGISYHASGIKVRDISSPVGLGWVLNAGGIIERTILGADDYFHEIKPNYTDTRTVEAIDDLEEDVKQEALWYMSKGTEYCIESQSDRYFYSFPTNSGVFRYRYKTEGEVNTSGYSPISEDPILLPFKPLKIEKVQISRSFIFLDGPNFDFKITDIDGTIYYFGKWDKSLVSGRRECFTTCNLTKIISSDFSDTIYFNYDLKENYMVYDHPQFIQSGCKATVPYPDRCLGIRIEPMQCDPYLGYGNVKELITSNSYIDYQTSLLTSISSRNTAINLRYVADRPDIRKNRLNEIVIKNNHGDTIKRIEFGNNGYFGTQVNSNQRIKLSNLEVYNTNDPAPQIYSFQYNSIELPPYQSSTNFYPKFSEDYWGYFNNENKDSYIPGEFYPTYFPSVYPRGDRNPDTTYMKACIIEKIIYPTGGMTEFQFESNQGENAYSYNNNTILGGLRIKTIKNISDPNKSPEIKTFKYGLNESGYAKKFVKINEFLFQDLLNHVYLWHNEMCPFVWPTENTEILYIYGNSFLSLTLNNQSLVFYDYVNEYKGYPDNHIGKILYRYHDLPDDAILDEQYYSYFGARYKRTFHWDRGQYTPLLYYKYEYDKNNQSVKSTFFGYSSHKVEQYHMGVDVIKKTNWTSLWNSDVETYERISSLSYFYVNTIAFAEANLLASQSDYIDGLSIITNYYYDNELHLQPTRKTVITSKNETKKTIYKYPHDFLTLSPYDSMVAKNIINPVIEQSDSSGTVHLQTTKNNYSDWGNNIIEPITIQTKQGSNPNFETRINYYGYDNFGNVLSVSKEGDIPTCYLWGYNYTYPVAKIVGATLSQVQSVIYGSAWSTIINPPSDATLRNLLNQLRTNINTSSAMVYTYTYKPLVGMTSETGPDAVTTYYEYDSFGRLQYIKDQDLNIIQEYKYHYKE